MSTALGHDMSLIKSTTKQVSGVKPRVLVVVAGGVADFIADDGVDVVIFDWDNYKSAPDITARPPKHFEDLAVQCDVPIELRPDSEMA